VGWRIAIESCNAASIAFQVVDAVRARLPSSIDLAVAAAGQGLPPVAADPDKLRQVLAILLDNAAKYSPDGDRIELDVSRCGSRIRFRIRDQGLGIPPAEQDRIFEKFVRLDPNLTRGVGGTGLGLYITRELVNRMEGQVWVASDGKTGSTFTVGAALGAMRRRDGPSPPRRHAHRSSTGRRGLRRRTWCAGRATSIPGRPSWTRRSSTARSR
jgi:signal transduction histidine kinase